MIPPIIVTEIGGWPLFFKTVQDAERYLEPPETEDDDCVIHDSEGHVLTLTVMGETETEEKYFFGLLTAYTFIPWSIKIGPGYVQSTQIESLESVLRRYVTEYIMPESLANRATLQELLETAITKSGFTR